MTFTAKSGRGDELATVMLQIAEALRGSMGCELYAVTRECDALDRVRVVEVWTDLESADAALATAVATHPDIDLNDLLELLLEPPKKLDVDPLGGVGI